MPVQKAKSGLVAKLGNKLKEAFNKHKADPIEWGNMELPPGINNGVAQLVDCKFVQIKEGKQNAGQYMFYAAGVVQLPEFHNGFQTKGLRTQISEPMFDTPTRQNRKTLDDHVSHVMQELQKLGVDFAAFDEEDLELAATMVKEAKPYFRFRTWMPPKATTGPNKDKDPLIVHMWGGTCEFKGNGEVGDGIEDGTIVEYGSPEDVPDVPVEGAEPAAEQTAEEAGAGTTEVVEAGEDGSEGGEELDLNSLAEAADNGDGAASDKLAEVATKAGLSEKDITEASNWAEVVQKILAATEGAEEGQEGEAEETPEPEPEQPPTPKKGEVWKYYPLITNPKTKKQERSKKPVDVEVVVADDAKQVASIKDLSTKKAIKGVKYSDLHPST